MKLHHPSKLLQRHRRRWKCIKPTLLLSSKVHPDKNQGSPDSKAAFQAVLEAFERLANPDKFEQEEEVAGPARKRQKTERVQRGNSGCYPTQLRCPRCRDNWNTADLGLEDAAFNFLMQGIKQVEF